MAGKSMQAIISLAGKLDPSLQKAVAQAQKAIEGLDKKTSSKGSKVSGGIGKVAKAAAVGIGAATAAAAAGVAKITSDALNAYGEYEQLVGGVDTLFKDSSGQVQQYAAEAYQTAGLSANNYMSTITSFSASLLQSLGGDTQAAAEMGNQAVIDMADNANKMGTNIEDIQRAYQSLARGQYGMLDNLKLGYGGTKGEMERLIADANKLREANGQAGDLTIDKFSDVVQAIHTVQDSMGITGTTAKEAATTIQGSVASAKAAYENWLTALGNENADIGAETQRLIESVVTAMSNIGPRIIQILASLSGVIQSQLPAILNGLISALPQLVQIGFQIVTQLAMAIIQALPQLVQAGLQIILMLIQGLTSALPQLIPVAIQSVIMILQALVSAAPMLLQAGVQLVIQLAQGLLSNLGPIVSAGLQLVVQLGQAIITNLPSIIGQIVTGLGQGIIDGIGSFFGGIGDFFGGLFGGGEQAASSSAADITASFEMVPSTLEGSLGQIGPIASGAASEASSAFQGVGDQMTSTFDTIPTSFQTSMDGMTTSATSTAQQLGTSFDQTGQQIQQALGGDTVSQIQGQWEGLQSFFTSMASTIGESFNSVGSTIQQSMSGGVEQIQAQWTGLQTFFTTLASTISLSFTTVGMSIAASFSGTVAMIQAQFAGLQAYFVTLAASISMAFVGVGVAIVASFAGITASVTAQFAGLSASIAGFAASLGATFASLGTQITVPFQTAATAIMAIWTGVVSFFVSAWAQITAAFSSGAAAAAASAASITSSLSGISGQLMGIVSSANAAASALRSMASAAASAASAASAAAAAKGGGFARGGFTSGPSLAGEDPRYPTEAVISFNPAYRAQNIAYLKRASHLLGMSSRLYDDTNPGPWSRAIDAMGGGGISTSLSMESNINLGGVTYAPNITIQGNGSESDVLNALRKSQLEFKDLLLDTLAECGVGDYGCDF